MTVLSKAAILAANDIKRELIEIPEWGGSVYIKELSAAERGRYLKALYVLSKQGEDAIVAHGQATLAAHVVVDETGQRLFSDAEIPVLAARNAAALVRIEKASAKLNLLSTNLDADVEAEAKN